MDAIKQTSAGALELFRSLITPKPPLNTAIINLNVFRDQRSCRAKQTKQDNVKQKNEQSTCTFHS